MRNHFRNLSEFVDIPVFLALWGILITSFVMPCRLQAQAVGKISGTIADPTGAVIPDAKITATELGTGLVRSTITGGSGTYVIPALPVGTYTVTAGASGFKSGNSQVALDVNQEREVDFTLSLAESTIKVEVSAAAPLLTTTNPTLGGLVTGQQVATLPLNGRDITNLIFLQPGVNYEVNSMWYGMGYYSSNGNRGQTGSSYLDGIDSTDAEGGGVLLANFNLDAVEEFKVLSNSYSAEFGRGAGSLVQLVSKSGSNEFHGSLFEFLRNSALDSRSFFSKSVPPFKRNEFGGTLGGPVSIPGLYEGKDRTFFFVQYAGFRQRYGSTILMPVPTAQERKGIVDIVGTGGQSDQLLVPLNPVAQEVLNRYPLPNMPTGAYGPRTFNFQYSVPENHDQWSSRIDHHFSNKDSIFGRFTYSNNVLPVINPSAAIIDPLFSNRTANDQRNFGLNETHIISPTSLNTLRLGLQSTYWLKGGSTDTPQTRFGGGSYATWGSDTANTRTLADTYLINEGINWKKGRHSISTGLEFRILRTRESGASVGGLNGSFTFNQGTPLPVAIPSASGSNDLAAEAASPSSIISFMVGSPAYYVRSLSFPGFGPPGGGFGNFGMRRKDINAWFQDDLKLTRNLTLNLGLRYEYDGVPRESNDRLAGIVDDPNFEGGKPFRQLVLNPQPMFFPDYGGWGPRFGFAYKLGSKTVLRGGYGIFTNLIPNVFGDQQGYGFPFAAYGTSLNPAYSITPLPVTGTPVITDLQGNPLPPGGDTKRVPPNTPVDLLPVQAFFGGPLSVNFNSMRLRNGYTMDGNLALQRELPGDVVLQVAYVSNNAAKLYGSEWPNAYTGAEPQFTPYTSATPGLGQFQLMDNHAHSTYNALQVEGRKVSSRHGTQFQVSYTWSKAIDNATTVFNAPGANSAAVQNDPTCWACEKSVSGFDFPHTLTLNFTYTPPLDKWNALSFLPRRAKAGWQIASIVRAQSGFPFTVTSPFGTKEFGTDTYYGWGGYTRPDLVQRPGLRSGGDPVNQFFSDDAIADGINLGGKYFAVPLDLVNGVELQDHPGNLGRNTFRSQSFSNFDFSLLKDTRVKERVLIQFRCEFFNLFNQHAFSMPGQSLGSSGYGISSSTVLPERQIQFGLRLVF